MPDNNSYGSWGMIFERLHSVQNNIQIKRKLYEIKNNQNAEQNNIQIKPKLYVKLNNRSIAQNKIQMSTGWCAILTSARLRKITYNTSRNRMR
jgi:hypothetical protein